MKITDKREKPIKFRELKVGECFEYEDSPTEIKDEPTVEAIPVTWIKKYIDFIDDKCLDEDACNTIRVMLNDWKEETNR